MIEKPLERLNYYNGQRLEASDLKLEQGYHIRVRRWLNRSLYSPGIARGLEVREEKGTRTVIISPGLALDAEGHEIILLEEAHEVVPGRGRHRAGAGSDAEVEGLYLTIRYDEQTVAEERGVCFARASGDDAGRSRPASGGPARISARPVVNWRAFLPPESSGEIVLAQVELDKDCTKVHQVNVGVRRYVGAASTAKVQQFALDGQRDIAYVPVFDPAGNRKPPLIVTARIYFHIRGRQPNAVTLYLRAEQFSPLHYTEMGHHTHRLDLDSSIETTGPDPVDLPVHRHDKGTLKAAQENQGGGHTHTFEGQVRIENAQNQNVFVLDWTRRGYNINGTPWWSRQHILNDIDGAIAGGEHEHEIEGQTEDEPLAYSHKHKLSPKGSIATAGVRDTRFSARSDEPITYPDDLEVWIGRKDAAFDQTGGIRTQLADANPTDWPNGTRLGDGTANHPLVMNGTGPIRLDFLPNVSFTEGEYFIELRVPAKPNDVPNGGRVLYNLYVE